jgi:hypothetical protein
MSYLSDIYNRLGQQSREPVNYKDPATRFAYVYKYVAAHADYLVQVMESCKVSGIELFESEKPRVSCIGGGPGSDIVAVLKYLDEHRKSNPVESVTCRLLDREQAWREQAWGDTWGEIARSLRLGIAVHGHLQSLDVTDPDSWKSQKRFLRADLFTLSFFVSEVYSLDSNGTVSAFWKTLFESAKIGARFIYTDNGVYAFNDYFDSQWKKAGLQCLIQQTDTRMSLHVVEEKSILGEYLAKFGQTPRLQGKITYRVLEKM